MIRKVHVALGPTEALRALARLDPGLSETTGMGALSERFRREVDREVDRHREALDRLGRCLEWLCRRGIARVRRPRTRGGPRVPTWLCPVEIRTDLVDLARTAAAEDAPEGPVRTTCLALGMILRTVAVPSLLEVTAVRTGNNRARLRDVLTALDAALTEAGVSTRGPLPAALGGGTLPRRERTEAQEDVAVPVTPATTPPEPAAPRVPKRSRTDGQEAAREPVTGFGALPDDAQPEDRRNGETLSPRGLTADAEFFLTEAGIAAWPCSVEVLDRARRTMVTQLHPDRAGEASTVAFHRVVKGHGELVRKLSATTTPEAAPPVVVPPAPVRRSTVGEWPPPTVPTGPPLATPAAPAPVPATAPAVSPDAAFFVQEARIAWPCDVATLQGAWRTMTARYRRAARREPGVTEPLARANRGYTDLLQWVTTRQTA